MVSGFYDHISLHIIKRALCGALSFIICGFFFFFFFSVADTLQLGSEVRAEIQGMPANFAGQI